MVDIQSATAEIRQGKKERRKREHNTHTHKQQQPFYRPLSGTTRVSRYQKKHSPTHHPDHHPIFISFFHLPRSIASSLFKLRAWQSFCTTSLHVLFGLPLGLEPSTSYSIHFFIQSVSSFCSTCPYHRNLFCCSIDIISSIPSLSLNSLVLTWNSVFYLNITHPSDHSHLCSKKERNQTKNIMSASATQGGHNNQLIKEHYLWLFTIST